MGRRCWISSFQLSAVSIHILNSHVLERSYHSHLNGLSDYTNFHSMHFRYLCWGDFVACKQNGKRKPFFAYGILFVCTLSLFISIGLNGWAFESFSTNPSIGPSAQVLMKMGAKKTDLIVNSFEIWRLLSPMILRK